MQVEQEKRREAAAAAAEKQAKAASTWWGWMTGAGKAKSPEDAANQQDDMRADLTADEYSKLQDMVSEQEEAVKTGSNMTYVPCSSDSIVGPATLRQIRTFAAPVRTYRELLIQSAQLD